MWDNSRNFLKIQLKKKKGNIMEIDYRAVFILNNISLNYFLFISSGKKRFRKDHI